MSDHTITLVLHGDLDRFLPPRRRGGPVDAVIDGESSLGHVVEAAGVPLPEIGRLTVDGRPAGPAHRPSAGERVEIHPVPRPQPVPGGLEVPAFLLDVHLGTLARRMRLVGLDTVYYNDRDDPDLVDEANADRRILLTQDRGILRRRNLWFGAYVRGVRPDEQFADVLGRFAPPLAPWTRCTACNGTLVPVTKDEVEPGLNPGTREAFDVFARCAACDHLYWRGSHSSHLDTVVAGAVRLVAEAGGNAAGRDVPGAARAS